MYRSERQRFGSVRKSGKDAWNTDTTPSDGGTEITECSEVRAVLTPSMSNSSRVARPQTVKGFLTLMIVPRTRRTLHLSEGSKLSFARSSIVMYKSSRFLVLAVDSGAGCEFIIRVSRIR